MNFGARRTFMRRFYSIGLLLTSLVSMGYLFLYGRELYWLSWANEWHADLRMLDDVSIWFYRERDQNGNPASPYRLYHHLSIVDPLDGPNWEIRIPGWIPAIPAI